MLGRQVLQCTSHLSSGVEGNDGLWSQDGAGAYEACRDGQCRLAVSAGETGAAVHKSPPRGGGRKRRILERGGTQEASVGVEGEDGDGVGRRQEQRRRT